MAWAKFGRRYRLFFRYDSKAKIIVYAWSMTNRPALITQQVDPYAVLEKMLGRETSKRLHAWSSVKLMD